MPFPVQRQPGFDLVPDPVGHHDLYLPFQHVDAMFGDEGGMAGLMRGPRSQQARKAGGDGVIDPRLRQGREQHLERSEEHTSELQSLMRNSYAVFWLKKKNKNVFSTYTKCPTNTERVKDAS